MRYKVENRKNSGELENVNIIAFREKALYLIQNTFRFPVVATVLLVTQHSYTFIIGNQVLHAQKSEESNFKLFQFHFNAS